MEWDTAATMRYSNMQGSSLIDINTKKELIYGKKDYENGSFIAIREPKDSKKNRLAESDVRQLTASLASFGNNL